MGGRFVLPLDGARGQASDEVALQREEDDQRQHHGDERGGGHQVPAAAVRPDQRPDDHRHRGGARPREHQRHQQVVPDPHELEDGDGGDGRRGQRQDDAGEDTDVSRAVDAPRLQQLVGNARHEVAQHVDGEWQPEGRVRYPQRRVGADDVPVGEDAQQRNEEHLQGDYLQADEHEKDRVSQREAQPREGVRRPRTDQDRQYGGRQRDDQAVEESLAHADGRGRVEHGAVVFQRELVRRPQQRPPDRGADVLDAAHGGEQQRDRRQQPDDADQDDHNVNGGPGVPARSIANHVLLRRRL